MKKLLSIVSILILAAFVMTCVPVSAATVDNDGVLIVTVNGENPTPVKVGSEFIITVGLYAGPVRIMNGQAEMIYDPDYVSFVPVKGVNEDRESYCFPLSICNSNLVFNIQNSGLINYNFSRISGVALFSSTDKRFARFRMKAEAPGTVNIIHTVEYMMDINDRKIFNASVPDPEIGPYTAITVETPSGCIGDADNDLSVTVLDAVMMQRIAAGADLSCKIETADVTGDGLVSLKDALIIRRYLAGKEVPAAVGTWMFASEQ